MDRRCESTQPLPPGTPTPFQPRSGYQVLPSNGRLEADFLDRLQEALGGSESSSSPTPVAKAPAVRSHGLVQSAGAVCLRAAAAATVLPVRNPKRHAGTPFKLGDPLGLDHMSTLATQKAVVDRHTEEEAQEAKGLEEILRNQAHPTNLVAVKKGDTPVLASPIADAKVLFLAAAEDEFEILDANPNWVHVRISGISRGWIRRSSLEMPTPDPEPTARGDGSSNRVLRKLTPSRSTWRMNRSRPSPGTGNRSREKP